jgi:hypothetical protein
MFGTRDDDDVIFLLLPMQFPVILVTSIQIDFHIYIFSLIRTRQNEEHRRSEQDPSHSGLTLLVVT